jgi:hypothetical protein
VILYSICLSPSYSFLVVSLFSSCFGCTDK